MVQPIDPFKFQIKLNVLAVFDALTEFAEVDGPGVYRPLPDIMFKAGISDYNAMRSILIKLSNAGLADKILEASPPFFRLSDPAAWTDNQHALVSKFEHVRPAYAAQPMPAIMVKM